MKGTQTNLVWISIFSDLGTQSFLIYLMVLFFFGPPTSDIIAVIHPSQLWKVHIHRAINGAVLRKKIREREKHKKLPLHDVGVWLRETLHYVFFTWIIFQREIWDHWRSFFYVEIFPTKQAHQEKHGFCNPLIESLKGKTMHNNGSDTEVRFRKSPGSWCQF